MIEDFNKIPKIPAIFGEAKQIAYVVDDIDEAMQRWHREFNVGPFLVTRNAVPLSNAYYRGEKARTTRLNIAFAYVGDMQLELIELIGDTPGLYKEFLDRGDYGVNHYAVLVDDFAKAYNQALDDGWVAIIDSGMDGLARMSYIESPDKTMVLEVIEWNPLTRPYFNGLEKLVRSADSSQLVHEFDLKDITPKVAVFNGLVKFMLKKLFGRVQQTRREPIAAQAIR
jgi:Glyoxalase/Bleomycin resistance protein/Dioxygenase superfamily